ncbi:AAA family ATPase [Herpetosiphon gulosus]|uniref:Endonuclease GajA/Old nuclease/RecF-like AAA domain-containing protein n=1 Tax=Herpetosiphon gulosus TaxID=1973496 RepID=A0ABP9WWQ4_9CHLR
MSTYIKRLEAYGIHNRYNIIQNFDDGINILYGKNGAGKTTILHILTNLINEEFDRFRFIDFKEIKVLLSNDETIRIIFLSDENIIKVYKNEKNTLSFSSQKFDSYIPKNSSLDSPLLSIAYFPAFRTMIEAWISKNNPVSNTKKRKSDYVRLISRSIVSKKRLEQKDTLTEFARSSFGEFVPKIYYPSPIEIEARLDYEIYRARIKIADTEQKLLTQAFLEIFNTLSKDHLQVQEEPSEILEEIKKISDSIEDSFIQTPHNSTDSFIMRLRRLVNEVQEVQVDYDSKVMTAKILNVYRDILKERAYIQKKSLKEIEIYLNAVNNFLEDKKIEIIDDDIDFSVVASFNDKTYAPLQSLSSGERQIITLLYATTYMSKQNVVLIDEPEISLHVDWQRLLLHKISKLMGDKQIIVCTHSPFIASDYIDNMNEIKKIPYDKNHGQISFSL